MSFRTILVPVDFSSHSEAAVELAVGLAGPLGARIELLHAYHLPIAVDYDYSLPAELLPAVREAAIARLDEWIARIGEQGVDVGGEVAEGLPSRVIAETVGRVGADLVVMGTHGRGGLAHALLGSVAERTIRTAGCPVMTVTGAEEA